MQNVVVGVIRRRESVPGDAFEVFGNDGVGPINYGRPLTRRPMHLWPREFRAAGHLLDVHLGCRHLGSERPDGHLEGTHLLDRHLRPERTLWFEWGPVYVGRYRFGVRVVDAAGNVRTDGVSGAEVVVNTSPEAPAAFVPVSSEAESGRMTFSFAASPQVGRPA